MSCTRGACSRRDRRDVFLELDYLVDKHRSASQAYGVEFDSARFSRWVASGHRAAGRRRAAARTYARGAFRYGDIGALPRAFAALVGERTFKAWRGFAPDRVDYFEVDEESLMWLSDYAAT